MHGNPDASFDRIPARYRHARLACIEWHISERSHVSDKQQASLYLSLNIYSNKLARELHRHGPDRWIR